jgi:hypothetical protein
MPGAPQVQHLLVVRGAVVLRSRHLVRLVPKLEAVARNRLILSQIRRTETPSPCLWRRNHSFGECWLKLSPDPTAPLVNMRGAYTARYRRRHPTAPRRVQWTGGVVKWKILVGNGTWSGRAGW